MNNNAQKKAGFTLRILAVNDLTKHVTRTIIHSQELLFWVIMHEKYKTSMKHKITQSNLHHLIKWLHIIAQLINKFPKTLHMN